jgi:Fe2+ transport system protein FeoA
MTEAPDPRLQCTLCGSRFLHGGVVCGACPIAAGCDLVKCPSCGYQFPRGSRLVAFVRRLFRRAPPAEPSTLAGAPLGQPVVVRSLSFADGRLAVRLAHLGLVPGATVTLRQRRPTAVVRVGETTIALQRDAAEAIAVERPA